MTHDLTALADELPYKECPTCGRSWEFFAPAKIDGHNSVRCIECKAVYPLRAAAVQGEPSTPCQYVGPCGWKDAPPPAAGWDEATLARAICRSDRGPGVPSCVMDDHPERDPCNFENCRRFEQAREVINALRATPAATKPADAGGGVREAVLRQLESLAEKQKAYFNAKQRKFPSIEDFTDDDGNVSLPDDITPLVHHAESNGRYSEADWWLSTIRAALSHQPAPVAGQDDPSDDERWQAGLDFAMMQLCTVIGVDPKDVTWDAATETVDGDVRAVIWNILRAKMGEDWKPAPVATNASAEPAFNWQLSDDAKARIAEIDDNLRNAALNAGNIVAGSSNASAEARLREALEKLKNEAAGILALGEGAMRQAVGNTNVACLQQRIKEAEEALSTHPHASDCDKQGER